MSACTPPDPAAFESGSARGVTPPLLPTLAMAMILGAASYFCHEPAAVAPPASVPATAVAAAPEAQAETLYIPAPLAFRTQFPLVVAAQADAMTVGSIPQIGKAVTRSARVAPRRLENPRVAAKAPPVVGRAPPVVEQALPFADEAEVSSASAGSDEGVLPGIGLPDVALPDVALPFAPTIRTVSEAGAAASAFVGAKSAAAGAFVEAKGAALGVGTASLGAAVSGWVGRLR